MSMMGGASLGLLKLGFNIYMIIMITTLCLMMCNPGLMRTFPANYVLLGVFTLAESILAGFVSAQYTTESVLIVVGITAIVVFGLSVFACQTSWSFTGCGPYLL